MSVLPESAWLAIDPPPPRRTVPCQLFDERLTLVGELLADGRLHRVPSGHLLVTISRPGQEVIDRFVRLQPGGRYLLRFFRSRDDIGQRPSATIGTRIRLQLQLGLGRYEPTGTTLAPAQGTASLKVAVPRRGIIVAELATGKADRVTVSLPPAREGPGTRLSRVMDISLEAGQVGRVALEADDLLRALSFLHSGQLREARQLVEPAVKAMNSQSPQDPVEAVVVGYVLLATHELYPAASWCADLPAAQPWLPDALVIAAEWFAAGGCHLTASAYLRQLAEAGLPLFTYGYERAVSRLRLYESDPPPARPRRESDPPPARPRRESDPPPARPRRESAMLEDASVFRDARQARAQELAPWDRSACSRTLAALARWSPSVDRSAPTLTVRWKTSDKDTRRMLDPVRSRSWLSGIRGSA